MSDKESKGERNPSASDQEQEKKAGHGSLTYFIVGAIILAIITGFFAPQLAVKFHLGGKSVPKPTDDDGCSLGDDVRDEWYIRAWGCS